MAVKGDVSDLDVLVYGGKPIVPQVAIGGYSFNRRNGTVPSDVAGGATRQRKKYYGMPYQAGVTFYAETPSELDFLLAFMRRNEGKYFICHLIAERPIVEPYVVQVLGDWTFNDVDSKDSTMAVQLEIISARDDCMDEFLYTVGTCWGNDICNNLVGLSAIIDAAPEPL